MESRRGSQAGNMRFTIGALMAGTALVALTMAALMFASSGWAVAIGTVSGISFLVALLFSMLATGPARAFAIGLALWGAAYYGFVVLNNEYDDFKVGRLPSTRLLAYAHSIVARPVQVPIPDQIAGAPLVAELDPFSGQRTYRSPRGYVTPSNQQGVTFAGPNQITVPLATRPEGVWFMAIGQLLWAWFAALWGGVAARAIYRRYHAQSAAPAAAR